MLIQNCIEIRKTLQLSQTNDYFLNRKSKHTIVTRIFKRRILQLSGSLFTMTINNITQMRYNATDSRIVLLLISHNYLGFLFCSVISFIYYIG